MKNHVDLWGHYSLLYGLLLYYQDTGYSPALKACEKIGDMVVETFGPGKAPFPIATAQPSPAEIGSMVRSMSFPYSA